MTNKYVGSGKTFFSGFSKIFKGPQHAGKVATIGGVKPSVRLSETTKKFKKSIEGTKKAVKKGTDDFKKENPNFLMTEKDIRATQKKTAEKYNKKDRKEFLRAKKAKGGRMGFRKGTGRAGVPAMDIKSTPTKKLSEKQKKIARLAGDPQKIDKPDFKALQSRRKNKKVI